MFNVPKSTSDCITGKVQHGHKPGPNAYLSIEEEELASFLIGCACIGYAHSLSQVIALVQQVITAKGINSIVTHGWWAHFRQQHPEITLQTPALLTLSRAIATDKNVLEKYFDLLENTLIENDILNKLSQIFNCDETGMPPSPKPHKVIDRVGSKNPSCITGNSKSQITVLGCVNAMGSCIPPFTSPVINAWSLFSLFPSHHIRAAEEGVILFTLPPNTTHLCQPLDKSIFDVLLKIQVGLLQGMNFLPYSLKHGLKQ